MKIKTKEIRKTVSIIDDIIKQYKEDHPDKERNWRTYEQRVAERLKSAFKELKPLVHEAAASVNFISGETRGAKPALTVEQRVLALLTKHLIGKSNRNMAAMFVLFSLLSDIDLSYKSVERFYSDPEVIVVLHNLHILILKKKGVTKADCGGDGSGYSLTVKKHYATELQKLKDSIKDSETQNKKEHKKRLFVYSFNLIDIKSRLYIAFGMSFKSEKEAFLSAVKMLKETGIIINSLRLDRYYQQMYVELLNNKLGIVNFYIIPKKNATIKGTWEWKRMMYEFVNNTQKYLEEYFKRNQSESGFSEDKKRTGWKLGQKREDRIETANICTGLWHNLYWYG